MSEEQQENLRAQKEKEMQAQMQIDALLRKTLTEDARQRLSNVKLVKKELYTQALQSILMLVQQGHVQDKITDSELKTVLEKLSGTKKEINIRRK